MPKSYVEIAAMVPRPGLGEIFGGFSSQTLRSYNDAQRARVTADAERSKIAWEKHLATNAQAANVEPATQAKRRRFLPFGSK